MCILCLEWEKQKLTSKEALRAIGEMMSTSKDNGQITHLQGLSDRILDGEMPESTSSNETDETWAKYIYKK